MAFYGVKDLYLRNYRNLKNFDINAAGSKVFILGDNGSGKTNILESISLLSPGRGLRSAKLDEICNNEASNFEAGFNIYGLLGLSRAVISFDRSSSKKSIEFNEKKIPSSDLTSLYSIIWLTPQMEWLFIGPSSDRRRFFDRIIYLFDHLHASRMNKYEYYLKERMKILQFSPHNKEWLDLIELKLSEVALEIVRKRREIANLLQQSLDALISPFPKASITISGDYSDMDLEWFKAQFCNSRIDDKNSGRSNFGPHRSDLLVFYASKNIQAKFCSTGEQKAMLISLTIAQILALRALSNRYSPILLLDEIFVHLDNERREYLADFLNKYESQFWITSTEEGLERSLPGATVILL